MMKKILIRLNVIVLLIWIVLDIFLYEIYIGLKCRNICSEKGVNREEYRWEIGLVFLGVESGKKYSV